MNLHGFYNPKLARKAAHSEAIERPDLVAERNATLLGIEPYKASEALESHIIDQAPLYRVSDIAPDTWPKLKDWHRHNPNIGIHVDDLRFLKRLLGNRIPGPTPGYINDVRTEWWDDVDDPAFQKAWKATENRKYILE